MISQDYKKLNLPDAPGVYFFKNSKHQILYIGRATSLKDRIKSYFSDDLIAARGMLLVDMVAKSNAITFQKTDSVLEAIILESSEIKQHQPYFNTKEKDNRSYNYVVITHEEFSRVLIARGRTLEKLDEKELGFKIKYQFGPYPEGMLLRDALKIIRKIFPFRDAKANLKHQENFYKSLGLSPGNISKQDYAKTIRNLVLFFQGKKSQLIKTLEKEMKEYADNHQFEKAGKVRNTIYALNHIQDVSLIKRERENNVEGFIIEAYDIAHMSGQNNVGVMTVIVNGEVQKSQYRKFKISKEVNNDTAALKEVLQRRLNHPEWQVPNLVVIDGGVGQFNVAREVMKNIPVVAVVKNDSHKPEKLLGDEILIQSHQSSILLANAEAHRFAIAYHKRLRNKGFLRGLRKDR